MRTINYAGYRMLRGFRSVIYKSNGEIHYISGTDVLPVPLNIINLRLDITHLYYPAKNSFQKGRLKRREIFTELLLYTLTT